MSNVKKRDDEKLITIIVCGLFSGALLAILLTAGNLFHMGLWLSILAFGGVALCVYAWYMVIKHIKDPNKDYWRLLCILFAILAICVIMGHRGGWLNRIKSDSAIEKVQP